MNDSRVSSAPLAARWRVRLLLGGLFMLGGEALLWNDPLGRDLWEWPLLAVGYAALAAIILDVAARWRARDIFSLMALAGVYALLNAMLLNPAQAFVDLPLSLVSRVTGAHTLLGFEMLVAFLALTGGHLRHLRWILLIGALVVGLAWGTWARWSGTFAEVTYGEVSLEALFSVGAIGLALVLALTAWAYRQRVALHPSDMILSRLEWAALALILALIGLLRVAQGALDETGLLVSLIVLVLVGLVLWSRRNTRLKIILDYHLPIFPLGVVWIVLAVAILFWAGALSYGLPMVGDDTFNQYHIVAYGFLLYGVGWLPLISIQLGLRVFIRQFDAHAI